VVPKEKRGTPFPTFGRENPKKKSRSMPRLFKKRKSLGTSRGGGSTKKGARVYLPGTIDHLHRGREVIVHPPFWVEKGGMMEKKKRKDQMGLSLAVLERKGGRSILSSR